MLLTVWPVDQRKVPPLHPVAVKVAFSVPQTVDLSVLTEGAEGRSAVPMVMATELAEVPQAEAQTAVYVPAPTFMLTPVAPLDQVTVPAQPLAVKVAVSVPHTKVLFARILGAAGVSEVPMVVATELAEVPHAVVHVTVYVPLPTCMLVPVAPLDQFRVPVQPLAVKVAFSSPHTLSLSAVTDGD